LVSVMSLIGFASVFFKLQQSSQILFVFLALITFFYAIPMGVKTPKNLRSIGGVKIYIIAIVWAMTTVVLPVLESQQTLVADHWILVLQRTFIVIVLMLPFEIRDLDVDQVHLSTIPQKIGIRNTKIIGYALLGDSILLEFFKYQFSQNKFLILIFLTVLLAVFLAKSKKKQDRYYAAFWVEAVPVFALILVVILSLVQKTGSF
jgi:4-hydroxybenzoate polyprenyltransferase